MIVMGTIRMDQIAKAYDLPVNSQTVAEYRDGPIDKYCRPIEPPAGEHYGAAPFSGIAKRARDNPITRDSIGFSKK